MIPVVLAAVLAPQVAAASDNPLADTLASVITRTSPLRTPMVNLGVGPASEGMMGSASAGYAWGSTDRGILFPGARLWRVMLGVRAGEQAAFGYATVGLYTNQLGMLAADIGLTADLGGNRGAGPLLQSTTGWRGLGVRTTIGALVTAEDVRATASMELVVELFDLGKRL